MRIDMPEVGGIFDEFASWYDGAYSRPVDRAEDELTRRVLLRHIDPSRDFVLDVGCGTGLVSDLVQPLYYIGVDVSQKMLEAAMKKRPAVGWVRHDVRQGLLGWKRDFEVVTCINQVASFVDDYPRLVADLLGVSRRAVILSVPIRPRPTSPTHDVPQVTRPLGEILEPFRRLAGSVRWTTYSSPLHDRLPAWALQGVGVRWPRWLGAQYVIVEATVK